MWNLKKKPLSQNEKEQYEGYKNLIKSLKGRSINEVLKERMNVILIIIKTIKNAESTVILNESVKLIRHLASSRKVIEILYDKEVDSPHNALDTWEDYWGKDLRAVWHLHSVPPLRNHFNCMLIYQFQKKVLEAKPFRCNIRTHYVDFCRCHPPSAQDHQVCFLCLTIENCHTTEKTRRCFINTRWSCIWFMCSNGCTTNQLTSKSYSVTCRKELTPKQTNKTQVHISIFKQIAETFMYILQFHENHNRILREEGEQGHSEIIDWLVQLGRSVEESVSVPDSFFSIDPRLSYLLLSLWHTSQRS